MSNTILKDIENTKHIIVNDLEEIIRFLNRCAELILEIIKKRTNLMNILKLLKVKVNLL